MDLTPAQRAKLKTMVIASGKQVEATMANYRRRNPKTFTARERAHVRRLAQMHQALTKLRKLL